jgi:2-polyprenyl-6-methoxyphenol hydroxylase-like FAD-dependent oxidoreductase
MHNRITGHAVVLGAGIAGLLTARVLADSYDRVTVVERDRLTGPGARRGVPQGRHAHVLMPRGSQVLEELLPGILTDLVAAGALRVEPLTDFRAIASGRALLRVPIGASAVQASRPFLERHIRDRVRALDGVEVIDDCDVVGLLTDDRAGRVTGARIVRRAPGSAEECLAADLVVDALGRGGRTPAWLEILGYPRPVEECPRVDVGYATRLLRLAPGTTGVDPTVLVGPVPGHARGMVLQAVEDGAHLLTLAGFGPAHRPPLDPAGFLAHAATVAPPDILAAIADADPLTGVAGYRYPAYQRRRYERLRRFPPGLLVVGDALCSFSPVYAQGMTVAALQAAALRACLRTGPDRLASRFFRAAAKVVDGPWRLAVGADLALPEVAGRRGLADRVLAAYTDRVLAAAERDAVVSRQFMRVTTMLDAPGRLLGPTILRRVLRPMPTVARPPASQDRSRLARPAG